MSHKRALEDICYLWPEVRWPVANVVCEGPSIQEFDKEALLLGPTIAVNRAIAIEGLKPDFWAASDDPRLLWNWAQPYRHDALRFFSTDQNSHIWSDLLGGEISRLYSVHLTPMGHDENGMLQILPTVMPLLAWLLRLKVKRIRIFGADMAGMGSPVSGDWKSHPDDVWRERWEIERVLFSHVARAARERGARIERWKPPPKRVSVRSRSA